MANSITLSADIVNALSAKITAGTATAEEIVLYTTGLQRLQDGNDFQASVVGLSQSAIDAIEAANTQFQVDSASAVSSFETSTNQAVSDFDTAADNVVANMTTASNDLTTAKDELEGVVATLPTAAAIEASVNKSLNYTEPKNRMAFVTVHGSSDRDAFIVGYDHELNQVFEKAFSSDINYMGEPFGAYQNLQAYDTDDNPSTGNTWRLNQTVANGHLGSLEWSIDESGQIIHNGTQARERGGAFKELGVVVGGYDQDWHLFRSGEEFKLTTNKYPRTSVDFDKKDLIADNTFNSSNSIINPHIGYTGFRFPSAGTTGFGNIGFNQSTNKFLAFDTQTTAGDAYPVVATLAAGSSFKDIAYNVQDIAYKEDFDATARFTNLIIGTSGMTNSNTNTGVEAAYRGVPVMCDNDNVILVKKHANSIALQRWTLNGTGTDFNADFNDATGLTTSYGVENGGTQGIRYQVTTDGKFVVAYTQYYYYGCGFSAWFIRVSDGKVLKGFWHSSSWGASIVPVGHDNFLYKRQDAGEHGVQMLHMPTIFDAYADGSDISVLLSKTDGTNGGSYTDFRRVFPTQSRSYTRDILVKTLRNNTSELENI